MPGSGDCSRKAALNEDSSKELAGMLGQILSSDFFGVEEGADLKSVSSFNCDHRLGEE
jgi:hypothetical protein